MSEPNAEGKIELPDDLALFCAYGACMFCACQLQFVLGNVYGMSFEDPRDGCIPRVEEKARDAFENTLGRVTNNVLEFLPPDMRDDVLLAVTLRNYVAHKLPVHTRALHGNTKSIEELCERLTLVTSFFGDLINRLHAHLKEHVMAISGVSREEVEKHFKPWDELGEHDFGATKKPRTEETVVSAWYARIGGPRYYLEDDRGVIWQLADIGLAESKIEKARAHWTPWHEVRVFLPMKVTGRPKSKVDQGVPPFRSSFNYDLVFGNGNRIVVSKKPGAMHVELEVQDANGNRI